MDLGVGGGGGRRVHYVHPSATTDNSENHTGTRTLACLNWTSRIIQWASGVFFFFLHVSARNTQMHECLCITVHVCVTPSCPLWLSFPHYVKHAKLIELMTSLPTVHRSSLFLSCHLAPLFSFLLFFLLLLKKKVELGTKRVRPQYIKDINPRSGLCSIK